MTIFKIKLTEMENKLQYVKEAFEINEIESDCYLKAAHIFHKKYLNCFSINTYFSHHTTKFLKNRRITYLNMKQKEDCNIKQSSYEYDYVQRKNKAIHAAYSTIDIESYGTFLIRSSFKNNKTFCENYDKKCIDIDIDDEVDLSFENNLITTYVTKHNNSWFKMYEHSIGNYKPIGFTIFREYSNICGFVPHKKYLKKLINEQYEARGYYDKSFYEKK